MGPERFLPKAKPGGRPEPERCRPSFRVPLRGRLPVLRCCPFARVPVQVCCEGGPDGCSAHPTVRGLCTQAPAFMVCGESPGKMEWFAVVEWFGRPEMETNEARERRITMEAVVDAYNEEERAIGWYYYL